jgi:hypothetical protein
MVIFSGVKCWKVIPVRASLQNELHWGQPNISPLLPMFYSHRRYGVVVMALRYIDFKLLAAEQNHVAARVRKVAHSHVVSAVLKRDTSASAISLPRKSKLSQRSKNSMVCS